jgi:DNA mismatch repair protein MutS
LNKPRNKKATPAKPAEKPPENPAAVDRPVAANSLIMDQYRAAKEKRPDMMMLFRVGDVYELFGEDAEEASELLGLTLTTRDQATMAGFPHHQLEPYLHKLLKAGKRVAICDQEEDSLAKEPIRREVQRIVTPEADGR